MPTHRAGDKGQAVTHRMRRCISAPVLPFCDGARMNVVSATSLCRDCGRLGTDAGPPCPDCEGARVVAHPELARLAIAHVDCDAFYASVEKRDRPGLAEEPVIVGGGVRGVVTTCCYVARRFGVRSAIPMSRALRLCPQATVIRPDMEKYRRESARIRELMRETGAVTEAVSIDEAYLDLRHLEGEPAARALARLALKVERKIGVTVSIGLSANKMLAKIASDMGKPRGFCVIGADEAAGVLAPLSVRVLPGVGPVMAEKLKAMGIETVADLRSANPDALVHRFGLWARKLVERAGGQDARRVATDPGRRKSVGAETTFDTDLSDPAALLAELAPLCATVARRLAQAGLAASGLTLKLRRADWRTITRACRLSHPTMRAEIIQRAAEAVLLDEVPGSAWRLVGVTASTLVDAREADPPALFEEV